MKKFRPLTITVANAKSGVGKSTIIRYLSYSLALRGYKTLVVDEDPQANTTKTMILTKTLMAGVRDRNLQDLIVRGTGRISTNSYNKNNL